VDLGGVSTRCGDFALDELEEAVDTPWRNALIAKAYLQHSPGKKAVAFGVSVQHAQNITKAFHERGIPCGFIWGGMGDDSRRDVLEKFKSGEIKVLSNCMILTEGFDDPSIEAILMARPTKSKGLYIQIAGRGLRPSSGKTECLVLDFVDMVRKHQLCGVATLTGSENVKLQAGQSFVEAMEAEERRREITAPLRSTTESVDLFERSRFVWVTSGRNYRLNLGDGRAVVCSPSGTGYNVVLLDNGTMKLLASDLPLGYAQGVAEDFARRNVPAAFIAKDARWRGDLATERQLAALMRMGIPIPAGITKGQAHQMIDAAMSEPLSEKQLFFIRRNGLHKNPGVLTRREARELISRYKDSRTGAIA
jgi:hypothetical protein